ncbi:MAG: class I SAM-dependent methyltransferase [Bacilli bacterium]|nr:class I SAM-dependent methyltransferase [Bacilli bacterium]
MTKLSSRLQKISDLVEENHTFIDIGCDHGFLSIELAKKYPNAKIVASDINENALKNAKDNIQKFHLQDRISIIQSNGLENLSILDDTTIIISGMGSHTIVGILYQGYKKLKKVNTLILQSNNDLDFLRSKVVRLGYFIQEEKLVKDAGIIYTVIVFKKGFRIYSKKDIYLGPCLRKEKSSLFQEKVQDDLKKMESFYPNIPKSHYEYRRKIKWKIKMLQKIIVGKNEEKSKN